MFDNSWEIKAKTRVECLGYTEWYLFTVYFSIFVKEKPFLRWCYELSIHKIQKKVRYYRLLKLYLGVFCDSSDINSIEDKRLCVNTNCIFTCLEVRDLCTLSTTCSNLCAFLPTKNTFYLPSFCFGSVNLINRRLVNVYWTFNSIKSSSSLLLIEIYTQLNSGKNVACIDFMILRFLD